MSELQRPSSGLSVASSVATISSVSLGSKPTRSVKRVHTFGKREHAIKRDPNSAVVIRGWLYKQDSAGLRLWKRRWFVLSDFCLFYYRDSREETVLGSILLPSYDILAAGPREAKNRKFTFKAEHPGMRTYYFGADTQEDMNGWIRAMNQSALVVAENNNKMGHRNNLTSSAPEGFYNSYEDFTRSTLTQNGEHAKSAESLEIAHLSETRSQENSSSESLLGQDREGKGGSLTGPREPTSSSGDDADQFTPLPEHGTAPPSTPVCGVKKVDFNYDLLAAESERLVQRKDSICHVEEWVCLQKEKLIRESQESYSPRAASGQVLKGSENPHESFQPSTSVPYAQTILPASPAIHHQAAGQSETETYSLIMAEREWERKEEGPAASWAESPHPSNIFLHSTPSGLSYPTRTAASPPAERAVHVGQMPIRASRSYSLPPTPSDLSRPRPPQASSTPEDHASVPAPGGRPAYYSIIHKTRTVGGLSQRDVPDAPRPYHPDKMVAGKHRASSCEELDLIGSAAPNSKTMTRPHTPMGRVDIHPLDDVAGNHAPVSRHGEEKPVDAFMTSSRSRGQLMRSASRPQTPADRYDVLPSDTYSTVTMVRPPAQAGRYPRRAQHPGPEDDRLVDGYNIVMAPRAHGPCSSRMPARANTPVERVAALPVDEHSADMSLTPSLARHRTKAARYSDRTFMVSPACAARNLGNTPRPHSKTVSHPPTSPSYPQLPPLPPFSSRSASHVMPGKRISLAVPPHSSGMYRSPRPVRMAENDTDVLLTKLCGQDKLLQSLEEESARLRTDKEKLENALEVTRLNMLEFQGQENLMEKIWYQQRVLQDDLVHVRARLCDLTLDKDRAWEEHRALEHELHILRDTLEHVRHVGHPQDQAAAQRDLWMINDIISGLRANKSSMYATPELTRHPALMISTSPVTDQHPSYQQSFLHLSSLEQDVEVTPPRPPLPKDHSAGPGAGNEEQTNGNNNNQMQREFSAKHHVTDGANPGGQRLLELSSGSAFTPSVTARGGDPGSPTPGPSSGSLTLFSGTTCQQGALDPEPKASPPRGHDGGGGRKQRMSAEEQMQRMRRHQEAQIQERAKPGPALQRQGSLRSASTTNGGSQVKLLTSESHPDSLAAESPDRQKPALVKVTSSYFPITLATSQREKMRAAWFLESGTPPGSAVRDGDHAPAEGAKAGDASVASSLMTVNITSRSGQMSPAARASPPVRTSSKLVTATRRAMRTGSASSDVQDGSVETSFEFPNHFQGSFSSGAEPEPAMSPELQSRRRGLEQMKSMGSGTSPGTPPEGLGRHPDEGCTIAPEEQRERIMSLSYTLATEASQRSKLMTVQTLADEYSDDSVPEEAEDWDFLLQEVYASTQPYSPTTDPQTQRRGTTSRHAETEEPANRMPSQCSNPANQAPDRTRTASHTESSRNNNQRHNLETAKDQSDPAESPTDQRFPWDSNAGCYENWTAPGQTGTSVQDRAPFLKREQSTGRFPECNGRVTNCGYQLEKVDFAHGDMDKVVGYLKEGEEPVRVTLLQSSF